MSGGMPYQVEKGESLKHLEELINNDRATAISALKRLRDTSRGLWTSRVWEATTAAAGEAGQQEHFWEHWLGYPNATIASRSSGYPSTIATSPNGVPPPPTGWWWGYRGDVDAVLRRTLSRALEIALDVVVSDSPATEIGPPRDKPWPVELFWICGFRWLEGWVTWRAVDQATDTGVVTVLLSTPGFNGGHPISRNPAMFDGRPVARPVSGAPGRRPQHHGAYLVTHETHRREWSAQVPGPGAGSPSGEWRTPYLTTVDEGDVVTLDMAGVDVGLQ